jgi:hypothetical protein
MPEPKIRKIFGHLLVPKMIRPSKISWYNLRRLWTPRKEYGHHEHSKPWRGRPPYLLGIDIGVSGDAAIGAASPA